MLETSSIHPTIRIILVDRLVLDDTCFPLRIRIINNKLKMASYQCCKILFTKLGFRFILYLIDIRR